MKKNKSNGHRPHRHSIQQPHQPLTPFRGTQNPNESRYINRPRHNNNNNNVNNTSNNNSSAAATAARDYQHNQQKAQALQRCYVTPSSNTTMGSSQNSQSASSNNSLASSSTTTTTSSSSSLPLVGGENDRNNNGDGSEMNWSLARQTVLAQTNPALAYTVEHIQPNGPDLYHCKLVDRMYDQDNNNDDDDDGAMDPTDVLFNANAASRSHPHHKTVTPPEEIVCPHEACDQHHVPAHALFSLTNIASLSNYASPGSIIIFDIDDTLVKRRHYNSSLLSTLGTTMLHNYLQSPACNEVPFEQKQGYVNLLGMALRDFVLAENDTAMVVKELQSRGCFVFALTARSSTMATLTTQCLQSLGIDFTSSLPPSMPSQAIEPQTGSAVIDGVIYCNDCPKGLVFQKFLSMQWISFPIIHYCGPHTCKNDPNCSKNNTIVSATSKQSTHHKETLCPERPVWFIDDSFTMLQSMLTQWQGQAAKQLEFFNTLQPTLQSQMPCQGKLALVCCHYIHPTNYTLNPNANPAKIEDQGLLERVIATEISHFVQTGQILSDYDALIMLGYQPQQQSGENQSQQQGGAGSEQAQHGE